MSIVEQIDAEIERLDIVDSEGDRLNVTVNGNVARIIDPPATVYVEAAKFLEELRQMKHKDDYEEWQHWDIEVDNGATLFKAQPLYDAIKEAILAADQDRDNEYNVYELAPDQCVVDYDNVDTEGGELLYTFHGFGWQVDYESEDGLEFLEDEIQGYLDQYADIQKQNAREGMQI